MYEQIWRLYFTLLFILYSFNMTPNSPGSPKSKKFIDGYRHDGIAVLAVDNLPTEFPRDASREFSGFIRDYVYKIALSGLRGKKISPLIPDEVQQAIITKTGKLTRRFSYLKQWVK